MWLGKNRALILALVAFISVARLVRAESYAVITGYEVDAKMRDGVILRAPAEADALCEIDCWLPQQQQLSAF
jgi:hypothetical protein